MLKIFINTENIQLVLIGILMSPVSTYLFQTAGMPAVLPELIFVPYFLLMHSKLGITFNNSLHFQNAIMWTFILVILSLIMQDITIVASISTARSFFLVFACYIIGKNVNFDIYFCNVLKWTSFGATIGWALNNYISMSSGAYLLGNGILYGNMVAIPIAFASSLLFNPNYILFGGLFAVNIYLSMTSGLRRQISVSLLSALLTLFLANISGFSLKKQMISIITVFLFVGAIPMIDTYLQNNNELLYARVVQRTQRLIDGDVNDGDNTRTENFDKFYSDLSDLIIPHGFVSFQTDRGGKGIFVDSPNYMLSYTFGAIPFIIYLIFYIKQLFVCFMRSFFLRSKSYAMIFICSSIVFFLHFVESSMFSFSFTAPMTGIVIGLLFRNDHLNELD